jgi:hypothetical protein
MATVITHGMMIATVSVGAHALSEISPTSDDGVVFFGDAGPACRGVPTVAQRAAVLAGSISRRSAA